ncbi:g11795 [Coccomyxa viridis]|uniref:G11795 protein n=1 Tax=Coccomyxa viridis TaxID=1274662 RepID=A0ABP1G8S8_9CHLO
MRATLHKAQRHAEPGELGIEIQERAGQGRGIVSLGNEPNELLLSLPYDTVFMDTETDDGSHLPWNGRMAMRLLRQKHACEGGDASDACMRPWIASLPQHVNLPMFYASVADLEACEDADLIREALSIRESAEAVYESEREELAEMGYEWPDLQWALSVLHSRCFTMGSPALHLTVPGIDMANHTFTPNATVRIRHSPGAVQGRDALEEICDPPEPEPSRLELLALDAGIRAGEEVTISYGSWSSEVFFLFFGFLPPDNPWDSVLLFRELSEMIAYHDDLEGVAPGVSVASRVTMVEDELSLQGTVSDATRLVVLPSGYYMGTVEAIQAMLAVQHRVVGTSMQPAQYGDFLARRCKDLLDSSPSTYEQAAEALQNTVDGSALAISLRYAMRRKDILHRGAFGGIAASKLTRC